MDKLEVSPQSVRGYGNIIIPKLSTDFVGKYNEIYTDEDGYFVLSYGGVMLKASATVSNTIKGIQASLTVLVSTRDSDTPVSGLSVDCSVDSVALTGQTTDSTGKCTFTWTPSDLGGSSLLISVTPQDDYAGLSLDKTVTVGLLLGFYEIMTSLSLEDDEVYTGTFEVQVEDRSQLTEFVKDVWVASGGEPIVDEYGIIHICEPGDLVVESEGLEQLPEYSNVLFEEDVDLLTGAVYDMSITEDYEIVLDCLERDDIVPDVPTVSVVLTASSTSVTYGDTVVLTVSVSEDGVPVSGGTVSFYDGVTLLGTDTTDSSGEASLSTSSLSVGSHSLSAKYDDSTSNVVTVTVSDVPVPSYDGVSLTSNKSILSYSDSDSCTLSAQLTDDGSPASVSGVTVEFFKGSTSLGTADTNSSGIATKTYASAGSGDVSFTAEADSIISSEIYVEDCIDYQPLTSNVHESRWTIPSAVKNSTFGYSSDGWKFGNASSYSTISYNQSIETPYSMEFTITDRSIGSGYAQPIFGAYLGNSYIMGNCKSSTIEINVNGTITSYNVSQSTPYTLRYELTSSSVSVYLNGTLVGTKSHSITGNPVPSLQTGSNRMMEIKDWKIKPL